MKYLVIDFNNSDHFIVENINELIEEMYGEREGFVLDEAKELFFSAYDVFEIKGEIIKIN
jgi:hypothetical protein